MTCNVLRCGNPVQSILNVGPAGHPIEMAICEDHQSQIDQGARWLYDSGADRGGELRMARDLSPRVVKANAKGGLRSQDGATRLFTLIVEKHDGEQSEVEFELPPKIAEGFWRVLDRGRRPPQEPSATEPG